MVGRCQGGRDGVRTDDRRGADPAEVADDGSGIDDEVVVGQRVQHGEVTERLSDPRGAGPGKRVAELVRLLGTDGVHKRRQDVALLLVEVLPDLLRELGHQWVERGFRARQSREFLAPRSRAATTVRRLSPRPVRR